MTEDRQDILIVGMGLAGLATAARLTELGVKNIAVYASGFGGTPYIAAINFVLPENPYGDSIAQYYDDMVHAGYELGDKTLVRDMTDNTLRGYELLLRWGVRFAHNADGTIKLRHVSGHTWPRTLCSTERLIGVEILEKLTAGLREKGVSFHEGCECVRLLSSGGHVDGITVRDEKGRVRNVYAPTVVAAWGGVGHLFGVSTYPDDIRGNTLAMAHDAGAKLIDVEFLEYEPMVVMDPPGAVGEPCPTAMLGEGAYLVNSDGERFLLAVRPQGEGGSPKTLINREIWKQVDAGKGSPHGGVWVDLRHIDREVLKGYPWFFNRLMENGCDPNRQLVEVGPMAHSFSGGIRVDAGYRSTLDGLYAVGEACGGVHGACRSAGNAASQATLSGLLCAEAIAKDDRSWTPREQDAAYARDQAVSERFVPEARRLTAEAMGIYRRGETLRAALKRLEDTLRAPELARDEEARQSVEAMALMVRAALRREESRGTHMRLDFPESDATLAHGMEI